MGQAILQYLQTFPKWFQMLFLLLLLAGFIYAMIMLGHRQIDITMKGIKITKDEAEEKTKKKPRRKK